MLATPSSPHAVERTKPPALAVEATGLTALTSVAHVLEGPADEIDEVLRYHAQRKMPILLVHSTTGRLFAADPRQVLEWRRKQRQDPAVVSPKKPT